MLQITLTPDHGQPKRAGLKIPVRMLKIPVRVVENSRSRCTDHSWI
jgi:hypothetical protein